MATRRPSEGVQGRRLMECCSANVCSANVSIRIWHLEGKLRTEWFTNYRDVYTLSNGLGEQDPSIFTGVESIHSAPSVHHLAPSAMVTRPH